jgi:hypothetical protein
MAIVDPMDAIKTEVDRRYKIFDAKRQELITAYQNSKTTKTKLKRLAKIVRHHGEWMNSNMFTSGWVSQSVLEFAKHIEGIAEDDL